jgi:branched-chain amino acid transport system substrate-binding protein
MKRRALLTAFTLAWSPSLALAAGPKIAVVAPQDGNLAILGQQVVDGARIAADSRAEIVVIPESCEEGSGTAIANDIVSAGAIAAIGFLCTDSLEPGLDVLAKGKIPAITLSVRASIVMEDALKKGWPLFRLAPSPTAERDKIVEAIFANWKSKPFALLDDGTITSRETSETVREALEVKGMKATFIDNFRPAQEVQTQLLRRLAKAGVTNVFAAADRGDMSVMARDARAAKLPLTFMGGDSLSGNDQGVPLEKGVLGVTLPDYTTLPAAKPVVALTATDGKSAEGYVLPAHAAVAIVLDAEEIATGSGSPLPDALVDTPFDTVLGKIQFTKTHELSVNPFVLLEWNGEAFVPPSGTQ